MGIRDDIQTELIRLIGFSSTTPQTVTLTSPPQISIAIDFTAVDSMSCSFQEIRLNVPSLVDAEFNDLKIWAEELCQRVTYLLENIGPLELDPASSQVMIRSTKPDKQSGKTKYYEIILQAQSDGNFTLSRYESEKGTLGRKQVDIQVTHEVMQKLLVDLVDTIPTA